MKARNLINKNFELVAKGFIGKWHFDLGLEGLYCSPTLGGKNFHFKSFPFQTKTVVSHSYFADSSITSPLNVRILQILCLTILPFIKPNDGLIQEKRDHFEMQTAPC